MKLTAFGVLIYLTLLPAFIQAQNKLLSAGPEPSWVTINPVDYNNSRLNSQVEDGFLDLVLEKQISLEEKSSFSKTALKILTEAGVQNGSKITVDFDPAYQRLVFHSIRIIRNGTSINKLQLSKIKTIQQEKELDKHLYDGSISAVLFLEDVRKGDVIEYSYTLKGENPIMNGKYAAVYDTRFAYPISQIFYKLIVPNGRTVTIKNSLTDIKPSIKPVNGAISYEWKINDVNSLKNEAHTPSWHDSYPMIMVSEYSSWKEINEWALPLYTQNLVLSPLLKSKIEEIKKTNNTDEQRLVAAVRFVQDEIRYLGIEMGTNSHKPHHPNQIISQRFGDCKDKSYLLCTILKGLGIEASPVFINTIFKKTILNWLPSTYTFDHVTVRVSFNGKFYFFDPTIMYQRGKLDDLSYPNYEAGLVITDTTRSLTLIPLQDKGIVKTREIFKVSDMSGKANLKIYTHYTGSFADEVRSSFNEESISTMLNSYQKLYSNYFDDISGDSLSFTDNEETGEFTTIEEYSIKDFWGSSKDQKKIVFEPYLINEVIKKPGESSRTMPFAIQYPAIYEEEIEVELPEEWNLDESFDETNGPGFHFSSDFKSGGNKLFLKYAFSNKKDHVDPEEVREFLASMKKVDKILGYSLTYSNHGETKSETKSASSSTSGSGGSGYTLLYILLGFCVVVTYVVRRDRK